MHKTVEKHGVAIPKQSSFSDPSKALEWIKSQGMSYPIIVKPPRSAGTEGVTLCQNNDDVKQTFDRFIGEVNILKRKNEDLLVQEYLRGTEYIVDAVSVDEVHNVTDVWKYRKTIVDERNIIYDYAELMNRDDLEVQPLIEYQKEVLTALGFRRGISHGEIYSTHDGRVLLGEVGARLPGADVPQSVQAAHGIDMTGLLVDSYIEPTAVKDNLKQKGDLKYCRIVFLIAKKAGIARKVDREIVEALPSLLLSHLPSQGDEISKTVDLVTSPGLVVLCANDYEQVRNDYETIRSREATIVEV